MLKNSLWPVLLVSLLVVGCSGKGGTRDSGSANVEDRGSAGVDYPPADQGMGAESSGVDGAGSFAGDSVKDQAELLATRVIYFDFDSSQIREDVAEVIAAHGMYLANNPSVKVSLEGHADERGSREYNIGLGERRGQAVLRLLIARGASAAQLEVISYGEEKPAAFGHDEQSWQRNRRVELVYSGY